LVIDDERAIVAAFVRLLSSRYEVLGMVDAREALKRIVAGEVFDVILCDLFMPGMGGMEFYDELACVDQQSARRVVFLSGGAFTPDTQEFLAQVPNPTVAKPFDSEALLALLRTMTDASRS
jgi:CheY-like chemotaxis protein